MTYGCAVKCRDGSPSMEGGSVEPDAQERPHSGPPGRGGEAATRLDADSALNT